MTRERVVSIRLSDFEYDILRRRADVAHLSVSDLVRHWIEQRTQDGNCPECGTKWFVFDPPLEFDPVAACGVLRPGTYATNADLPICDMPAGHEGDHGHLVERLDQWSDEMPDLPHGVRVSVS